jgi:hypothetical protein
MGRISLRWRLIHMDAQDERIAQMIFPGPTDNELFSVMIEILFVKRRRIHRIEKLFHPIDVDLDAMRRVARSGTLAELTDFEIEGSYSLCKRTALLKPKP